MPYDVAFTRGLYSSLSDGWIYLNGQSAPQIPEKVSSAVATAFRTSAQIVDPEPVSGSHSRALQQGLLAGSHHVVSARKAIADLVGRGPTAYSWALIARAWWRVSSALCVAE